ncbi:unnamed protein product, partial [Adineta steineri]
MKLLLTGLWKLPCERQIIWSGSSGDLSQNFTIGEQIITQGFSSCTKSLNLLESDKILGKNEVRTFFEIECCNGKVVRNHSFSQIKGEVLLLPGTQLMVVDKVSSALGTYTIQLRELQNPSGQLLNKAFREDSVIEYPKNDEGNSSVYASAEDQVTVEEMSFSGFQTISKKVQKAVQDLKTNSQFKEDFFEIKHFENLSIEEAQAIGEALKVNSSVEALSINRPINLSHESLRLILEGLKINSKIWHLAIEGHEMPNWCDLVVSVLQ